MNWSKAKISSFAEVATGGTPATDKREHWDGGKIPWLNSGDLNQNIVTKASNFITEEGYNNSSTKLMPPNTVLIALTGATTGLVAILKIEACANQSVTGILPSNRHHPEFLYYFLRTQRQKILDAAWGGAQPHINQKYVKDYVVPIPPLPDQIKIATVLSKTEALIKQRKENIELLDIFLKSIFHKRFIEVVHGERKLDELTTKITDGEHKKPDYKESGKPFISVANITTGVLNFENCRFVSEQDFEKYIKRCNPEKDDILYSKVGATYGRAVLVDTERPFSLYVSVALIKPRHELINARFLKFAMNHPFVKRQADKSIKGAGVPDLHLIEIRSFKIPYPTIQQQNDFAILVEKVEVLKDQLKSNLEDLENLYGSLSQSAFKQELQIETESIIDSFENEVAALEYGGSIGGQAYYDGGTEEELLSLKKSLREIEAEMEEKMRLIDILRGRHESANITGKDDSRDEPKITNDKNLEVQDKRFGDPYDVDEATAKKQGEWFYQEWKKLHQVKEPKFYGGGEIEINWEWLANRIKERYAGKHFNFEMLMNYVKKEKLTGTVNYYSSEEMKANPKLNDQEDIKAFIHSAVSNTLMDEEQLRKTNKFITLKQSFYNAEKKNFKLMLHKDDLQLLKSKSAGEHSGIYFSVESDK